MTPVIPVGGDRDITITPVFKIMEIENIPKSETAGHAVMENREMVEIRFAGNKNYSPCVPTGSVWKREGNRSITYAERWPEQYRAFKEGNTQEAMGTPLEMLKGYGISGADISLCRALKIYSIEALYHLEGQAAKSLGMKANDLKAAARAFMGDRNSGAEAQSEIAALKAKLAALEARSTTPPETETAPEVIDAMVEQSDAEFEGMADSELKDEIASITGERPKGNPSRATLENALSELRQAQAA